jgi:hypothetical protein
MDTMNKVIMVETVNSGTGVASTATILTFADQPFLRGKFVTSLEIYSATDIPISPLGNAVIPAANISAGFLSLYSYDPETQQDFGNWTQLVPLWDLHQLNNGTDPYSRRRYEILPRQIQWEKSFFQFATALGNTANLSILLNVGYQNSY